MGQSRNIRNRIAQHCNENGDHNSASFAFNIAKQTATMTERATGIFMERRCVDHENAFAMLQGAITNR